MRLHKYLLAVAAAAAFTISAMPSSADIVIFDFRDDTSGADEVDQSAPFDGGNGGGAGTIGSSFLGFVDSNLDNDFDAGEPDSTISISVVDIIGQTGSRASAGGTGNGHLTNVSGQDALSINDGGSGTITGGGDSSHFNPGEGVDLVFNEDVFLSNVELESFSAGQVFTVSTVDPETGSTVSINLGDSFNDLGETFPLAANQTFTISFVSTSVGDDQVRVESLQVTPVPTAIPEPSSSLALVALGAIGLITRRKRA